MEEPMTETTTTRRGGRTLDQRMAAVQRKLEDVERRGHAEITTRSGGSYTYDYITEPDLMRAIRPLLAKEGIAVYYSDEIKSYDGGAATVRVSMTLAANGEERVLFAEGYATDLGDKAANKAKTNAVRYLLWKTFLQPSDDGDPEQENVDADSARAAADERARRAAPITQPRRAAGAPTVPQLLERIGKLALEVDEVQGVAPGRTHGSMLEAAPHAYGKPLPQISAAGLVRIGQALANFASEQREKVDRGETADDTFVLPEPTDDEVPF
jgi:hypothetical protein